MQNKVLHKYKINYNYYIKVIGQKIYHMEKVNYIYIIQ